MLITLRSLTFFWRFLPRSLKAKYLRSPSLLTLTNPLMHLKTCLKFNWKYLLQISPQSLLKIQVKKSLCPTFHRVNKNWQLQVIRVSRQKCRPLRENRQPWANTILQSRLLLLRRWRLLRMRRKSRQLKMMTTKSMKKRKTKMRMKVKTNNRRIVMIQIRVTVSRLIWATTSPKRRSTKFSMMLLRKSQNARKKSGLKSLRNVMKTAGWSRRKWL